ncbi:TonB-dependent receptor [Nostoc sp.]|uniref:TonB-dependent receptor n=1 Tax=Nostoc sp. TaxID=1180 RepID=UPI002FF56D4E
MCFVQPEATSVIPEVTSAVTKPCFAQPKVTSVIPEVTSAVTKPCFAQPEVTFVIPEVTSAVTKPCFAQPKVTSALTFVLVGFYFAGDKQVDLANTCELPSYFRTDAAIFYKLQSLRVGFNFKNLFNIDYFDSASFRDRVFYGDPFTVQGTISWEF